MFKCFKDVSFASWSHSVVSFDSTALAHTPGSGTLNQLPYRGPISLLREVGTQLCSSPSLEMQFVTTTWNHHEVTLETHRWFEVQRCFLCSASVGTVWAGREPANVFLSQRSKLKLTASCWASTFLSTVMGPVSASTFGSLSSFRVGVGSLQKLDANFKVCIVSKDDGVLSCYECRSFRHSCTGLPCWQTILTEPDPVRRWRRGILCADSRSKEKNQKMHCE